MRGAVHRILCIPRKLLETCRLRVRFCPAGIGRRLQRGGKQQKRRLAKSLTGHDCRDRHNSIGADYAESVHNSGGKVVRWEDVQQAAFDNYRAVRDQLMGIPDRVAAEFAVEDDPKAIRQRLVNELELALTHVRIEDGESPSKV